MQTSGTPERLVGTMETSLMRIAQEAVANAAKHAGAKHIHVRLHYAGARVTLEIEDDGQGFDVNAYSAEAGHFGLSGMKERCEKIGGQFHITSKPGGGVLVSVSAPAVTFQNDFFANPP